MCVCYIKYIQDYNKCCFITVTQGAWTIEGNKLIGKFTRVDNGKELIAVREVSGNELIQVSCKKH